MDNQPLLSLCIPIYNRLSYLERQLARMLEDKDLFASQIQLIISDNCSTDDLRSCCEKYQQLGLRLHYHRQDKNIGPDGNFDWCFHHADGQYVWLLGSDDIPIKGLLRKLVDFIKSDDYGLIHLSMKKRKQDFTVFHTSDDMTIAVNYWITFMSANIIRTESLKTINLSEYKKSYMIQVPAYLNACCLYTENAIMYFPRFFEKETDNVNNGGYDFFQVFVTNLFSIYETFVEKGLMSQYAFEMVKKIEFKEYLVDVIIHNVIMKQKRNFTVNNCWGKLKKYYRFKLYAYVYMSKHLFAMPFTSIYYRMRNK